MAASPSGLQQLDASGGVDLGIPVRAVNRSTSPITWVYARAKHILQPGQHTFVPYMAMVYYQGDPRAIDVPGGRQHEQFRSNELARLRIVHGIYEESEGHNKWDEIPLVECYPIDSDVPFATVLRDPEGHSLTEQRQDLGQTKFLQDEMERMAAQLRILQAQAAASQQSDAALGAAGIDPTDLDRAATTSKAISPEEATGQSMVGASPTPRPKTRAKAGEGPAVTVDE